MLDDNLVLIVVNGRKEEKLPPHAEAPYLNLVRPRHNADQQEATAAAPQWTLHRL